MNKYVEALKDVAAMNQGLGAFNGVYSIVAGGAARDVDFRKPFKDIDIFVVMDTDDDRKVVQVQDYYEQFFQFGDIVDPDNPYEENLNNIVSVENHTFNRYDTLFPVQIIFQKSQNTGNPLKEITDQFDLGACQIAFKCEGDGQYRMVKSEQYKQDKADEKVRLSQFGLALPTPERRRKTRARAERIANKLDLRFESMWPEDVQARQQVQDAYARMLVQQREFLERVLGNRPVARAVRDIQPAVYYNPFDQMPINGGQ